MLKNWIKCIEGEQQPLFNIKVGVHKRNRVSHLLSVCLWIWGDALVAQHQKNHRVWSLQGTGRNKASGRDTEKETKMERER